MNLTYYLNIPYRHLGRDEKGVDCFGLVRLFYNNELKIYLKDFTDYDERWFSLDSELILKKAWLYNFEPVDNTYQFGDVLLFEEQSHPKHLGVVINGEVFLHTSLGGTSCNSYVMGRWSTRIVKAFRHKERK